MNDLLLIKVDSPEFSEVIRAAAEAGYKVGVEAGKRSKYGEFVNAQQAMEILECGMKRLQYLRDNDLIEFTKKTRPAKYVTESIYTYLRGLVSAPGESTKRTPKY